MVVKLNFLLALPSMESHSAISLMEECQLSFAHSCSMRMVSGPVVSSKASTISFLVNSLYTSTVASRMAMCCMASLTAST